MFETNLIIFGALGFLLSLILKYKNKSKSSAFILIFLVTGLSGIASKFLNVGILPAQPMVIFILFVLVLHVGWKVLKCYTEYLEDKIDTQKYTTATRLLEQYKYDRDN